MGTLLDHVHLELQASGSFLVSAMVLVELEARGLSCMARVSRLKVDDAARSGREARLHGTFLRV